MWGKEGESEKQKKGSRVELPKRVDPPENDFFFEKKSTLSNTRSTFHIYAGRPLIWRKMITTK